jgi:AmpD protein
MAIKSQDILHPKYDLDPVTGLVSDSRQQPSPNFDDRPLGASIEALVIHAISLPPGQYADTYVEDFFCNQLDIRADSYFSEISGTKVSSHFYIRRNGDLVQFVPIHKRAWHAGISFCMGREAVNDFSIGVELEGCDDDSFEDAQYRTLVELSNALLSSIATLSEEHIYGHSDISPGRKTDPGPEFDWKAYRVGLSAKEQLASKDTDVQ